MYDSAGHSFIGGFDEADKLVVDPNNVEVPLNMNEHIY